MPPKQPKGRKKGDDDDAPAEQLPPAAAPAKKKGGKRRGGDSEEDEEEDAPAASLPPASAAGGPAGKGKKKGAAAENDAPPSHAAKAKGGKRRGGDSDEEDEDNVKGKAAPAAAASGASHEGLSGTAARKAKREAKKKGAMAVGGQGKDQKRSVEGNEDEDEDDEKQQQQQQEEEEEEDDEEASVEEIVRPPSSAFAALSLDEVVDSDAVKARRADKKKKKRELEAKLHSPHHHDDNDDVVEPPPQPPRTMDIVVDELVEDEDEAEQPLPATAATAAEGDKEEEELDLSEKRKKKKSSKERKAEKLEQALKAEAEAIAKPPDNKVFAVSATSVNVNDEAWKQRQDIGIPKFSISTKGKTLFNDAELRIAAGRRYGLVGPNGLGKSVLLRAIANGDLPIPPSIDSLYVEQEVMADQTPAIDVVLSADVHRAKLIRREKEIFALIDSGAEIDDKVYDELLHVTEELRATGADGAEAKALRLLRGLGFSEEMARSPTENLSGGWRMRVSIAKGLYLEPTLLLLDEPTNHLDLEAVIFLESVLSNWSKTLVVVSHDQDFLDEVCQEIIHLEGQKLWYFNGNYSNFEEQHSQHLEKRKKDWERAQKELKEQKNNKTRLTAAQRENKLKEQIRLGKRGGASEEEQLAISAAGKNRGEKQANAEMERPREYVVTFSFPEPTVLNPPIIQVRDVAFHYPGGPVLFKRLNFGLDMDSRICVCGPNGSGKSTLIGLITQALLPTDGEVLVNRSLRVACYKQHFVDALPLNLTPVEYLNQKHNVKEEDIRARLGRYGLSGVAHKIRMASLSGGQKARVVFADMSYQNPHMLILDEPSNNLDMESIRALGVAINEFEGGVILVSHDTRLITETNMVLWVVERQTVLEQVGGIEAYRDEILEKLAKQEAEAAERLKIKEAKALQAKEEKLAALDAKRKQKTPSKATQ